MHALKAALLSSFAPNLALVGQFQKAFDAPAPRKRDGFSQELVNMAYGALMTGPKATPPRWKTVRRIIYQFKHGIPVNGRRVQARLNDARGTLIIRHPTKRRPIVEE